MFPPVGLPLICNVCTSLIVSVETAIAAVIIPVRTLRRKSIFSLRFAELSSPGVAATPTFFLLFKIESELRSRSMCHLKLRYEKQQNHQHHKEYQSHHP